MDFDFETEKNNLKIANESISRVIEEYDNHLQSLTDKQKNVILLAFHLKKLDTYRFMKPVGNYSEEKKNELVTKEMLFIEKIANRYYPEITEKYYPEIINSDELKKQLEIELKNAVSNDMKENLEKMINGFSKDIKNAYKEHCKYVYTMLPISGLTELIASPHRENQYYTSITDGVFSTSSMPSIQMYIARANVGGMHVNGRKIIYPSNPFSEINEKQLILKKTVSIYLSSVELFEPQFDYEIDKDGKPHFIFGSEWIAPHQKVPCLEQQTTYLPHSFLERFDVNYGDNGKSKN